MTVWANFPNPVVIPYTTALGENKCIFLFHTSPSHHHHHTLQPTAVPIHGKTTDGNMHIFNVPLYYFTPQHASTTASNFSTNSRATE